MGKSNGTTRSSSASSPNGLTGGGKTNVLRENDFNMWRIAKGQRFEVRDNDFSPNKFGELETEPKALKLDIKEYSDLMNNWYKSEAKELIAEAIKKETGEEISKRYIEYDKDNDMFIAWHKVSKPGDIAKTFWRVSEITEEFKAKKYESGAIHVLPDNDTVKMKVKYVGEKEY